MPTLIRPDTPHEPLPATGGPIRYALGHCSLGAILVAESPRGLCAILLGDEPDELIADLSQRFPEATTGDSDQAIQQHLEHVVRFVETPSLGLALPLDIQGTAFQKQIWQVLQTIPSGATISYTELAARIGSPASVRAVANACGANPLAVAIPCHRVIRNNGDLAGYRWGLDRKRTLLKKEAA